MAIIALPPEAKIKRIEWTFDRPSQVNRSDWTKARQVVLQPGKPLWSAKADFVTRVGEANMLAVEAFLIDLDGPVNSFRLRMTENAQCAVPIAAVVDGAGPFTNTLTLRNGVPGLTFRRGMKLTVLDQGVMLMSDASFDPTGKVVAVFKPRLRISPPDGTPVELRYPTSLVSITGSSVGWTVDPGQQYAVKQLELEEAF